MVTLFQLSLFALHFRPQNPNTLLEQFSLCKLFTSIIWSAAAVFLHFWEAVCFGARDLTSSCSLSSVIFQAFEPFGAIVSWRFAAVGQCRVIHPLTTLFIFLRILSVLSQSLFLKKSEPDPKNCFLCSPI
ncbi:hypothetical protein KFK09_010786 [Dendrobium nobile]|uniref:Uncharacterized protein n=1 Tax=Dendrobium nobile TaxID=94219 RepID=A0A8T3BCQ2_DENNO|nr:hypothetical protein KFK09_010784 [Dendrobium nobile]KAI0510186.1 hypothetical protein KFK09_010786 [Dendrobium nobile]